MSSRSDSSDSVFWEAQWETERELRRSLQALLQEAVDGFTRGHRGTWGSRANLTLAAATRHDTAPIAPPFTAPCPDCLAPSPTVQGSTCGGYLLVCTGCAHHGPIRDTEDAARAAWNAEAEG